MSVAFGTSGLRGLVTSLSDKVVGSYVQAFTHECEIGTGVFVGQDLRSSSPRIAQAVIAKLQENGLTVVDCGVLPTPALAMAAMEAGAAAIMVTGSHIPDDRNGLKFFTPKGEISKDDEIAIRLALDVRPKTSKTGSPTVQKTDVTHDYISRYSRAFGPKALEGLRLGVYQHSSAARDILVDIVLALGGEAVPLARADRFIPVDTEAVDVYTRDMLADWANSLHLDAILSTDGDADRPMLSDADGRLIPGDILGVLTAQAIGADLVCTPVSSNSMIDQIANFRRVDRCKIGSPYVIAAMENALLKDPMAKVVGFEANGGFLLGFSGQGSMGTLTPLMTRDAILPLIAPLASAVATGKTLRQLASSLPPRATASDRLVDISNKTSSAFMASLIQMTTRAEFIKPFGIETAIDQTDGIRITLQDQSVVHLRPSGNAPEFRIYVEASNEDLAQIMLQAVKARCEKFLNSQSINGTEAR